VLRHVYAADVTRRRIRDVQTLWVRACTRGLIGARPCGAGGYVRLRVYALQAYGVFKVRFFVLLCAPAFFLSLSIIRVWFDRVVACLWQVGEIVGLRTGSGRSSVIMFGRVGHRTVCRSVELGTSPSSYLLQYAATAHLAPSHSIIDIDTILGVFYSASWTVR
jgi:hypothetical protein